MRLRRFNNAVHRDLGYLVAGTTILYAVSGVALNHADAWNPHFVIRRQELQLPLPEKTDVLSDRWARSVLEPLGQESHYRGHDLPTPTKVKIYLDEGSVLVDLATGKGVYESVSRRPVFYRINCLHINPERAWLVLSDVFAVALVVVCLTGVFVLRGRKGITGRGAIFAAAGLLVPLVFLLVAI